MHPLVLISAVLQELMKGLTITKMGHRWYLFSALYFLIPLYYLMNLSWTVIKELRKTTNAFHNLLKQVWMEKEIALETKLSYIYQISWAVFCVLQNAVYLSLFYCITSSFHRIWLSYIVDENFHSNNERRYCPTINVNNRCI